jgi:hypothetical protein
MKNKSDFVAIMFNENEPHTSQEWWIYWLNRYHAPTSRNRFALRHFFRDKVSKGLVSDLNFFLHQDNVIS